MYGKKLRGLRKKAKLTLEQVAQKMHTTHTTVSRYENDKRKMEPETLAEFCKLYNVSADYLLDLPKDMPYPDDETDV
ncbi:MAG: helix-turn-helix transcriptional regulator [Oscillospiraceae bacterium]|nr:helix-turn-helix transcriptional regulator [Oscillospiraceae bacterium]